MIKVWRKKQKERTTPDPGSNVVAVRVHTLALVTQLRVALDQYERDSALYRPDSVRKHA